MHQAWAEIAGAFDAHRSTFGREGFGRSFGGVADLARHIADDPRRATLFGWQSMHDLCIQQTDAAPYSGPYLRVSPLASGTVVFRYVDTFVRARQWSREVPAEATIGRFESFLDQLGWLGRTPA